MSCKPPRTQEAVLLILRDTLQKLELNPDPEIDTSSQIEFKRLLRIRIAHLEAELAATDRFKTSRRIVVPKLEDD
jgi:hypothetical protein